jgi:hypothetical protein
MPAPQPAPIEPPAARADATAEQVASAAEPRESAPVQAQAPAAVAAPALGSVDPPSPPAVPASRSVHPAVRSDDSEAFSVRSKLLQDAARESPAPRVPDERDAVQPPPRSEGVRLAITLAALVAIGFLGWRAMMQSRARQDIGERGVAAAAPARPRPASAASESPSPAEQPAAAGTDPAAAATGNGLGRTLPFIDHSRNVAVSADQGLLVVEYDGRGGAPRVSVAGRDLGSAPLAAALPAGRHELTLKSGDATRVRYFLLRAGETQIVQLHD